MQLHVKKGDNVLIIAGKDKGKTGKIVTVNPDDARVVVDNLNIITKHTKPRGANAPGGINKVPGPIDASNVQIICPKCNKATRVDNTEIDGKKFRACSKCAANLDEKKADKKAKKAEKVAKADAAVAETAEKPVKKTAKSAEKATKVADKTANVAEKPAKKSVKKETDEVKE